VLLSTPGRTEIYLDGNEQKYKELSSKAEGESSQQIRKRAVAAREIQMRRFVGRNSMSCNADMHSREIQTYCKLDSAGEEPLKMAITKLGLSARAYDRILKCQGQLQTLQVQ